MMIMTGGETGFCFEDIIGESEILRKTITKALRLSRGDSTVLITGESGTGKEMFAKSMHNSGMREKGPFVTVNCGAISENLVESELFGYERGAFTGADKKGKPGKFELAHNGTVFLDEIGDMPLRLQVKLLHVLQNKTFERVGSNTSITVSIRIIAATNKNLERMVREKTFREDLYYRLNVVPLEIAPLRERSGDTELLMRHFLKRFNGEMNKNIKGFTDGVKYIFAGYEWPGNVRELKNAVEYGVNMATEDYIGVDTIPMRIRDSGSVDLFEYKLKKRLKEFERDFIREKLNAYEAMGLNKEFVAGELGMSRATFYRKLKRLEIL